MKLSKKYIDVTDKYVAMMEDNRKQLEILQKTVPEVEAGQVEEAEHLKAAAISGDAEAYRKAKTMSEYYADRLGFLRDQIAIRSQGPIAEQKEVDAMLRALDNELQNIETEANGNFIKKLMALAMECEELKQQYEMIEEGKNKIETYFLKKPSMFFPSTPYILTVISDFVSREISNGKIFAPIDFGGDLIPLSKDQRTALDAEKAKWDA